MSGSECVSAIEPHAEPILKFIGAHGRAAGQFGYWHKYESLVVIYQRDSSGTTYRRYYLFTHERADSAELLSEDEGEAWLANYEAARRKHHEVVIDGPSTDIGHIKRFFE